MNPSRPRVVLADDDILLRESLASLLDRSGLEVVGQEQPDLAVVDIRMPPKFSTEGLEAARVIQREFPQTAVMVLSVHVEVEQAMDLLAGLAGLKDRAEALGGKIFLDSPPGAGTSLQAELPLKPGIAEIHPVR